VRGRNDAIRRLGALITVHEGVGDRVGLACGAYVMEGWVGMPRDGLATMYWL
jgi:hypothetical protein